MKIVAYIRSDGLNDKPATIRFRLRDGRGLTLHHASEMKVKPSFWDSNKEQIKAKVLIDIILRNEINAFVSDRKKLIADIYAKSFKVINKTSKWLSDEIAKNIHPDFEKYTNVDFFTEFERFINEAKFSKNRKDQYNVILRLFKRFELYTSTFKKGFRISFDIIDNKFLTNIEEYYRIEHKLYNSHKFIFDEVLNSRRPRIKGNNTIIASMIKISSFIHWAMDEGFINKDPFKNYKIGEAQYGTPVYISIEERNLLYEFDFSKSPKIELIRDIFIFHCFIGCRVSDLFNLTKNNIINNSIEYIARKTLENRPFTVSVPLSKAAFDILKKYDNPYSDRIFPKISLNQYNNNIKIAFKIAGLNRKVVVLDKHTGAPITAELWTQAASHMARRTFIGNIYKFVKDPNLIGALSGHKEGSKAFVRYRHIDDDIKRDLINFIE
jgi:site-specific recombinase XerD